MHIKVQFCLLYEYITGLQPGLKQPELWAQTNGPAVRLPGKPDYVGTINFRPQLYFAVDRIL